MNRKSEMKRKSKATHHAGKGPIPKRNRRKAFDPAEEERLSRLLFGDGQEILENLDVQSEDANQDDFKDEKDRVPAWDDEDDSEITVGKALDAQGRRLPEGGVNERTNKYSNLLAQKFKTIYGTPKWADLDKDAEYGSDEEILKGHGHVVKSKSKNLPKSILDIKRMSDLNKQTFSEGPIVTSAEFHPTSSVALVAGLNGVISIYAVDGRNNEKLHTLGYNRYPIHRAKFTNDGDEVILGGQHAYYHCYNLMTGESRRMMLPHAVTQMKLYQLSPCGNFMVVGGRFGEVYMISSKSKELLCTMKQSTKCTGLAFNSDGTKLYAHGSENEVTVFDMKARRVCQKFIDEGCVAGASIDVSPSGQYLATGSAEGVANLYDIKDLITDSPKPLKSIMNLTTSITGLRFNCTSEILALTSADTEDAVKLVHLPTATVFKNFPGMQSNIARPLMAAFSPGGGYLAIPNNKHTVPLYRIKHYNNY